MGDNLENKIATCGIAGDYDVLRLDPSGDEMFDCCYSLLELSGERGGWDEGWNQS